MYQITVNWGKEDSAVLFMGDEAAAEFNSAYDNYLAKLRPSSGYVAIDEQSKEKITFNLQYIVSLHLNDIGEVDNDMLNNIRGYLMQRSQTASSQA